VRPPVDIEAELARLPAVIANETGVPARSIRVDRRGGVVRIFFDGRLKGLMPEAEFIDRCATDWRLQ
jgi:hypothetical protein